MTKGAETRERILDRAFRIATRDGLEGLTIGALATELGLSKSGLFAHFGSKEEMQVEVLRAASARFTAMVAAPALRAPRGLPRLRKLFDLWLSWLTDPSLPGGCLFMSAAAELDDREGKPRDVLVEMQHELRTMIARIVQLAIDEGHFRKVDPAQFAFELHAIMLGFNVERRLFRNSDAEARARASFERLVSWAEKKS